MKKEKIEFKIYKIYTKNIIYKSYINNIKEILKPKTKIKVDIQKKNIFKNIFEITLILKLTAKYKDKLCFKCLIEQSGIFFIKTIENKTLNYCINVYCPEILYPYLRECISNITNRSFFNVINIIPINFALIYKNKK